SQRQGELRLVFEGVHLLVDDVGGLAGRPSEQARVLEAGRLDPPPAVGRRLFLHRPHDVPPEVLRRQDVVRPTRRLELAAAHCDAARSSCKNGLVSSSRPSVVIDPWPGYTSVSGPNRSSRPWIDSRSVCQSAPGRSTRPTDCSKRRSPENSLPSA